MDYSFLKLHDSLDSSLSLGDYKNTQLGYATSIQLSPNETYSQMTNVVGGLALDSDYQVDIIDKCENVLLNIDNNVFFEQFTDVNGDTQTKIEIVNIGRDFFGRAVQLKFTNTLGDDRWYTNPIKITDSNLLNTVRFDYTNNLNMDGLTYENADFYQSIRINCEYSKYVNESSAGEYYQISSKNTISTRFMRKIAHEFRCNTIDIFTLDRLQKIFEHDTIYLDGIRVTNNPTVNPGERIGYTNLTNCTFKAFRNESDTFSYAYQIFEGVDYISFYPSGYYITGTTFTDFEIVFNYPITLATGTVLVYNDANTLIATLTEADMSVTDVTLSIDVTGTSAENPSDDVYYVTVSGGLVTYLGVPNEAIEDSTTWTFTLLAGQYDGDEYDSDNYLTD